LISVNYIQCRRSHDPSLQFREDIMFAFVGNNYPQMVVVAMAIFAGALFSVSVIESLKRGRQDRSN